MGMGGTAKDRCEAGAVCLQRHRILVALFIKSHSAHKASTRLNGDGSTLCMCVIKVCSADDSFVLILILCPELE